MIDLKGYKRGEAHSESRLMISLEHCKEGLETYTLGGNTAMINWYQGRCMQILDILGYEDSIGIVHQWEIEALKAKEETEEPVQAVCFLAQPVANGAEVPVLEDETLCDGCHHARCICDYLAAEQAAQGDISAMKSLGHSNETITWVKEGGIKPEEFLPDD